MKRTITVLFFMTAFAATGMTASAAPAIVPYKSGSFVTQAGVGLGFPGQSGALTVPPIIASVEYQLKVAPKVPLSFGLVVGYAGSKYTYTDTLQDTFTWNYSDIILGARAAYHFGYLMTIANLDPYAGVMLGYDIVSVKTSATGPYATLVTPTYTAAASGFTFGGYVGARYYFTPLIAAYGELGYNLGYINLGAAFKF